MDKGLDIDERRCVLAFQAAAPDSRKKQTEFSRSFVRSLECGASIASTARALAAKAKQLHCRLDWAAADKGLAWAERPDAQIITIFDPDYPPLLREIIAPPIVLFARGRIDRLGLPSIAMVGSRKASHYGTDTAFKLARAASAAGFSVTSGLAGGIDAAAHRGALDADGITVAVFGCGIDRIYPASHTKLAGQILSRGVLVSEFQLGSPPRPYHFPRRNRIISGLSCATVVVEAAIKSGSISTAMHALEQGREVFAVPGSIHNPMAKGCHHLISQGATLLEDAGEMLLQLPVVPSAVANDRTANGTSDPAAVTELRSQEQRVIHCCEFEAASFDQIVQRSGLTPPEVSSILSALEVRRLVRPLAGNKYLKTVS